MAAALGYQQFCRGLVRGVNSACSSSARPAGTYCTIRERPHSNTRTIVFFNPSASSSARTSSLGAPAFLRTAGALGPRALVGGALPAFNGGGAGNSGAIPQRRWISAPGTIMTVTPTAAERVVDLMEQDPSAKGIKIALRQRGCSGMSYVMDFQKEDPGKFDETIEFTDGSDRPGKVVVDAKAVLFLVGTEMDYVEVEMGSEFVFRNPNEKGKCGCGQSFNV